MRVRIKKQPMSQINVVPYIDVMLVLLIIFMITAPLLTQGVKVDLPQARSEPMPPSDQEPVIISIDKAGDFFINYGENQDRPVSAQALTTRISALIKYQPGIPIYVKGDAGVPYGKVVVVMALLQNAGAQGIGLVTEPLEQ
jgi:biopolymer transport protein TolR